MANYYDKVLKENVDISITAIAEKLFGLDVIWLDDVKDKIQTTIEREIVYLKKGILTQSHTEVLLQFEFETKSDRILSERMLLYFSVIFNKYSLPIKQYVVYIGRRRLPKKLKNNLDFENLKYSFEVKDIRDIPYDVFLNSSQPEEFILAVLCDFKNEPEDKIVDKVFNRLIQHSKKGDNLIGKYIYQLRVLSNLRNLQPFIDKKLEVMPIEVDVSKDPFFKKLYKKAIEEGLEKGKQLGLEKGREVGTLEKEQSLVLRLLKSGQYSIEQIADIVNVKIDFVKKIKKELEKE